MFSKDKKLVQISVGLAVLIVGLSIVGAFRSYSPVPYGDMWDGYISFLSAVNEGDNDRWWAQHNEHRILLARLLFWADSQWFGGLSWFLITVNYFLVTIIVLLFCRILHNFTKSENFATSEILLCLFMTAWLFLWIQNENLTWGFQGQFFLAQLLPLCGFYWLNKSVSGGRVSLHFFIACGFGVVSVGTMANGTLVLPLMIFYALVTRQSLWRVVILATLSLLMLYLYFHDYNSPGNHDSLSRALKENPFGLFRYILLYLGSPFFYLGGKGAFGKVIAQLAGLFIMGSSAFIAIKALRQPQEASLKLALLFFILYIGGTAFGTAGGRLLFGLDQALSSRYTTPALMAWAALLVLCSSTILEALRHGSKKPLILFGALAVLMILQQVKALKSNEGVLYERKIAALALELGVKDQKQIINVYPNVENLLSSAKAASIHNFSIFGQYPFRDIREQLGMFIEQSILPACQGNLDTAESIDDDARFIRVGGWIYNATGKNYPAVIRFVSSQGMVVGYAITGQARSDVSNVVGKKELKVGYRGYMYAEQIGSVVTLQGESPACQMQAKVP